MHIQVNSGSSIGMSDELVAFVQEEVRQSLWRFDDRLSRIEVHLNDVNSHKGGAQDKRCQIEARPAGLDPVSASHQAPTEEEAIRGAAAKMQRLLDSIFGRLSGRSSPRP